jgi:hypothetical protein
MIIHEIPSYVRLSYNSEKNYILFDWTDFDVTLDEIKVLHQKALDTALQTGCFYFIAETSKVKTILRKEVVRWFGEVWVPKLAAAGLKAIVTVVPDIGLATLSTRHWQAGVVASIKMKNVTNLAEAEAFLEDLQRCVVTQPM